MLDDFVTSEDITLSIDETLTVLLGNEGSDLILVLLEELLILEHVSNSGRDGDFLPSLEGLLGVLHGGIEL